MKTKRNWIVAGYVVFMFAAMGITPFVPEAQAINYASIMLFVLGFAAIFCQKVLHREKFLDLGFRLNRNAALGILTALVFTGLMIALFFWLPLELGWIRITLNPETRAEFKELPPVAAAVVIMVIGGLLSMPACLFGEELAFRGYLLPKLAQRFGVVLAVLLNAVIFGLWHLPAYYSIYRGGAADQGVGSVALMLLAHGVSVIPVCILFLTTRELYGVSLYHCFLDIFQYAVVGSSELGAAAKDAMYQSEALNQPAMDAFGWAGQVLSIFVMLGLCWIIKRWVKPNTPPLLPAEA